VLVVDRGGEAASLVVAVTRAERDLIKPLLGVAEVFVFQPVSQ